MQKRIKSLLASFLAIAIVLGMLPGQSLEALAATVKSGYEILVSPTLVYKNMYRDVENHKLAVMNKSNKEGIIDINGNVVIPFSFDGVSLADDGKLAVVRKGSKYGVYNVNTKKEIFPCKYVYIEVINSNFILLYSSWSSVGIYNASGKAVVSTKYNDIFRINDKLVCVYKNNKYGVMNLSGKMVYDCVYSGINFADNDTKILLKDNNGVWKLHDLKNANNVVTIGEYDRVYDYDNSIMAYCEVENLEMEQEYTYDGALKGKPRFYYYNWQKNFQNVEKYNILYLYDENEKVLDVYNYSLEKIATFENVDFLMEDGMFHKYVYNYDSETIDEDCYYVFNGEENVKILDLKETSFDYASNSSGSNVYIGQIDDTEWRAYAADGSVAIFTGNIMTVETYANSCLVVSYDDDENYEVDRYVLANYDGQILETLLVSDGASYGVSPGLIEDFFFAIINGEKWLYGVGGKKICKVGAADDFITDVTNSGGTHYYIENDTQNKTYMLDENLDYVTTVDAFDYYHEYDEEYISIDRYNEGNEILGFDGTIHFSSKQYKASRKENDKWLAQTRAGVWELYNSEFEKIGTLGNGEYVSYDEELKVYKNYTSGDDGYLKKFGVYSATGKAIIPTGSYKESLCDYESKAWLVLNTKKQAIAFNSSGTKLCTIPDVKEIGSYNDGYFVFKSTNNKYGIYKVTKVGHTHKLKSYVAKKATVTANGYTAYKKCTVCGDITGKTTVNKASKITASSKTYTGKTVSTSVSVKDSAGKTIAKSNYTVSGTTKAKKVGTYKVKVKFKGSKYSGTKTITWKIKPTATKFTKVTAGKKKITLKWSKKTKEVTGYKIQYSTDKNFKKSVKTITIKKDKTTSKTISKLKSKKKYYVRICTYKGSCTSSWSKVKSVKVK